MKSKNKNLKSAVVLDKIENWWKTWSYVRKIKRIKYIRLEK